jgi:hypothetical protein
MKICNYTNGFAADKRRSGKSERRTSGNVAQTLPVGRSQVTHSKGAFGEETTAHKQMFLEAQLRRSQLLATAYNGAGHTVIAWHLRVRVRNVSVVPGDDYAARCTHARIIRRKHQEMDDSSRGSAGCE